MVNYWCGVKGVKAMINKFVYIRGGSSSNVWEKGRSLDRVVHSEGGPRGPRIPGFQPQTLHFRSLE